MRQIGGLVLLGLIAVLPAEKVSALNVVYPPNNHQTTAERIFFIGTAPAQAVVTINGQVIGDRSPAGHFAPSLPLQVGDNTFTLRAGGQTITLNLKRLAIGSSPPTGLAFAEDSLTPKVNIARLPNEPICFSAIAPPQAEVTVKLGKQVITLPPQAQTVMLPPNTAALTATNQPIQTTGSGIYQGCTAIANPGKFGAPVFQLRFQGKTLTRTGVGQVEILDPADFERVEVIRPQGGAARTGPSTDHSRMTPLPPGTQARVTGKEGDWLRLEYGGWIRQPETRSLAAGMPVQSVIRSVRTRQVPGWTEVVFPLQIPVPLTIDQGVQDFSLTLFNTTAQTDVIALNEDPVITRLDWQQISPGQVRYRFNLRSTQQWGYKLRYQGTSLILSLRHPPALADGSLPLKGIKIVLDPGHGSSNDRGSVGPSGYPEKDVTLVVSKLLQQELSQRGATVVMTRTTDQDLDLQPRVDVINQQEPAIALSVHYNALPDDGDALNTSGVGTFWYQAQSQDLAIFLHRYLAKQLRRPSYGVFWNNLALTRPTVTPCVLLELGFMINPQEFEWITNASAQKQLAATLAEGIVVWLRSKT
jgi:N-acetylmuramoyl-L-alanine amidase